MKIIELNRKCNNTYMKQMPEYTIHKKNKKGKKYDKEGKAWV